jgi:hypothetical protein
MEDGRQAVIGAASPDQTPIMSIIAENGFLSIRVAGVLDIASQTLDLETDN